MSQNPNRRSNLQFPQNLYPATYGGWGQQRDTEPGSSGGLLGRSFPSAASTTPSHGRVRILALLGASDQAGRAAPNRDGFYVSDFYYLHHLLKNSAEPQHQAWLTCARPEALVSRYQEYTHGDPQSDDRRVVLDSLLLPQVQDVRVFAPSDLRNGFLQVLRQWTKECTEQGQQLLVILIGHGIIEEASEEEMRIVVGAPPTQEPQEEKKEKTSEGTKIIPRVPFRYAPSQDNRLSLRNVRDNIEPGTRVTIIGVACFFGEWVISPRLPNITVLSAVNEKELLSWPEASAGRCCGTRYVSAISEALIQLELPGIKFGEDGDQAGTIDRAGASYAALARAVYDTLREKDIRQGMNAMATAQNDHWDQAWRPLSGFRMADIEQRHLMLRRVPKTTTADPFAASQSGGFRIGSNDEPVREETALQLIRDRAMKYLGSNPGRSDMAGNQGCSSESKAVIAGKPMDPERLEMLGRELRYRLYGIMKQATEYRNHLQLEFPRCEDMDPWTWRDERAPKFSWSDHWRTPFDYAWREIRGAQLFDQPGEGDGLPYGKGSLYLAAAFTANITTQQGMDRALDELKRYKLQSTAAFQTVRGLELHKRSAIRERLEALARQAGRQIRGISPVKKSRGSIGQGDRPGSASH